MRKELVELVEAARGLQVQLAPKPENPHCVRIGGDRETFPERLYRVAVAIEAVDRIGAASFSDSSDEVDPAMDAARLRMALDGVFRWMRSNGMDITEPHAVVIVALGVERQEAKASKGYKLVPQFAPNGFKRNMRPKPMMNLVPQIGDKVSMDALRQKELQASMTDTSLGPAAPKSRPAQRG